MIVVRHLNNSRSQSVPWLLEELGLQVRPAYLAAAAPILSRSEGRRQAASDSSIASSVGVVVIRQAYS